VSYQPPLSDGGSPVTGYHVERRAIETGRWLRVNKEAIADLRLDVADLLEGNDYEFRVAAENRAGIGEFSTASPSFTAKNPWDKPGKPGRPVAVEVVGATVRLQWTAPESDGGAEIFNYVIEFRVEGSTKWTRYEEKEMIATVEHTL
jgi:titin